MKKLLNLSDSEKAFLLDQIIQAYENDTDYQEFAIDVEEILDEALEGETDE